MTRCSFGLHVWGYWSLPVENLGEGQGQHKFCSLCGIHKARLTTELAVDATPEFYNRSTNQKINIEEMKILFEDFVKTDIL
jgi:hypothetical protein